MLVKVFCKSGLLIQYRHGMQAQGYYHATYSGGRTCKVDSWPMLLILVEVSVNVDFGLRQTQIAGTGLSSCYLF